VINVLAQKADPKLLIKTQNNANLIGEEGKWKAWPEVSK
jgi:hypothetical protein